MKNTLHNSEMGGNPRRILDQSAANYTARKYGKYLPKGLLAFAGLSIVLLFTACSEEPLEADALETLVSEDHTLTLAPDPGEPIYIARTSGDVSDTDKRATKAGGNDHGRFNITLQYVIPPTERQQEVFDAAAGRWEGIIIKDVPSVEGPIPSAFGGVPDIEGTIDDIIIEVALAPIDGPGGILGQAGPRFVRTEDFLTLSGVMFFDAADLAFLEELDLFEEVIVHEMGHVLGIGTLWNVVPFGFDRTLRAGPDSNPYFTGKMANVFWNAEGGVDELPVENMGGPGTALSHWREATLNNELMTGFLNLGVNPLSRITAGSMKDLGYGSAPVGESYDLPRGTPDVAAKGTHGEGLNIAEMEVLLEPIGFVSSEK
ncbi:MAG TPA: leishmanolysin-related zinc metalloendopeptidase [Pricia sp.]|nr:leishmanolysin-related zinc metalloendopeptidase [Pricia sp.]